MSRCNEESQRFQGFYSGRKYCLLPAASDTSINLSTNLSSTSVEDQLKLKKTCAAAWSSTGMPGFWLVIILVLKLRCK